jgi:hypothetical protein
LGGRTRTGFSTGTRGELRTRPRGGRRVAARAGPRASVKGWGRGWAESQGRAKCRAQLRAQERVGYLCGPGCCLCRWPLLRNSTLVPIAPAALLSGPAPGAISPIFYATLGSHQAERIQTRRCSVCGLMAPLAIKGPATAHVTAAPTCLLTLPWLQRHTDGSEELSLGRLPWGDRAPGAADCMRHVLAVGGWNWCWRMVVLLGIQWQRSVGRLSWWAPLPDRQFG